MPKYYPPGTPNWMTDLVARVAVLQRQVAELQGLRRTTLSRKRLLDVARPIEGQLFVWGTTVYVYTEGQWRLLANPSYEIKVRSDTQFVTSGDEKFWWPVPKELDNLVLFDAQAGVSTAGSSVTTVQIRNESTGNDLLATRITIDAGQKTSYTAATPSVVQPVLATRQVHKGDGLWIDVDTAGAGAKGLCVIAVFELPDPPPVAVPS